MRMRHVAAFLLALALPGGPPAGREARAERTGAASQAGREDACERWRRSIRGRPQLTAALARSANRVLREGQQRTAELVPGRRSLIVDQNNRVVAAECG
jgi:hypothetical protein